MPTDRLIYQTPGSCSRVALNALEEIGLPFREESVAIMAGATRQMPFLGLNPKGRVPVLVENDVVITELPVILYHLARSQPAARLLPVDAVGEIPLEALSDLIWLAGTLQSIIGRTLFPASYSRVDPQGVKATASIELAAHAKRLSERLEKQPWWHGAEWSITDVMVCWLFTNAGQYGFSLTDFAPLTAHRARVEARPSFVRAREREVMSVERDGLTLPPGFAL